MVENKYTYTRIERKGLRGTINQIAKESINSSFGVCFLLDGGRMKITAISPSSVRIKGSRMAPIEAGFFKSYEGYMSKPSFLPLYIEEKGLEYHLNNLSTFMLPNEKVVIQFMFRKLNGIVWKEELLKMYDSYLRGNDFPLSSSLGRRIQDKAISTLGRLGNFQLEKEYIEEVEDKLLDVGYEFQMAVGILSKESDALIDRVSNTVKKYDFYNAIRFRSVGRKDNALTLDNKGDGLRGSLPLTSVPKHIISEKELFTLLVGGSNDEHSSREAEIIETTYEEENDIYRYLPENTEHHQDFIELDTERLVAQIAGALKRVGVISTARLYGESVIEGVRLIVVQFDIPKGKNITHIQQKSKDIQAALGVFSLTIEQGDEPDTVKLILPNDSPSVISLREVIELDSFQEFRRHNELAFVVGVDEIGNPIYLSLSKLVHLLVAGTTGSGKSVFINSLATSLICTHTPEDLQMIMIDPKMVELQHYSQFPQVREVITDMSHAEAALRNLTVEMDSRYEEFQRIGVKGIQMYNASNKKQYKMPYLVCIVDEYADLKDTHPDVEGYIGRLGQKARASGIHMVIATQRPDTKVISGRIKAVIPSAISFNLNNNNDYRTVFGSGIGDIELLGLGDGLMSAVGHPKRLQRFQACMISTDESREEQVYRDLANYYKSKTAYPDAPIVPTAPQMIESASTEDGATESAPLDELKGLIATTGETRLAPIRSEMRINTSALTELMRTLVEESWLIKHDSGAKRGYEIVAPQEELDKWKT